jgi:hypothetical protein
MATRNYESRRLSTTMRPARMIVLVAGRYEHVDGEASDETPGRGPVITRGGCCGEKMADFLEYIRV